MIDFTIVEENRNNEKTVRTNKTDTVSIQDMHDKQVEQGLRSSGPFSSLQQQSNNSDHYPSLFSLPYTSIQTSDHIQNEDESSVKIQVKKVIKENVRRKQRSQKSENKPKTFEGESLLKL